MCESINARPEQPLGILQVKDVSEDAKIARVRFIDNRSVQWGRQLWYESTALVLPGVIYPNLDNVHAAVGEPLDRLSGFSLSCHPVDLVSAIRSRWTALRQGDSGSGRKKQSSPRY